MRELLADARQWDAGTGSHDDVDGMHLMKEFRLPLLTTGEAMSWEPKHNPNITFQ
jgi:hypothetical protein